MRVEKNVPEIRFEGFSGEWKISQLSELALFNPKEELPVTFKYVDLESVKGTSLLGYREELKESAPSRAQRLAKKGDVFFQTVRPYQKNNYLFNMEEIDFVFSTGYAQLRPYYDGNFLLNLIQRDSFVKDVLDNCTGTSYPAINASILASLEVISPEGKEEQTAIGNTFQKLDNLINQHQQKHDKLSNIKKAMLEKMFPKQGETMPEIRFKGFSGEWVEKGITDISKVFIGLVTTMTTSYRSSGVLLIRNSDIKSNRFEFSVKPIYLDEKFADENSSRRLMRGDVVTVHTGDVGTSAVVTEKEEGSIGFATIVSRPIKNFVDSNYLAVFLNTDIHKSFAINVSTGDGRANYNLKDFYKLNVPLPTVDEQAKIGIYFQKLDALINQHKQQITKLNNIKQACLSKMFV